MRILPTALISIWACIYTSSLAWALWRRRNYRGGVGTALLALAVLVAPVLIALGVQQR